MFVVNNESEAIETYRRLLHNEEEREKIGNRARERVLREHTFKHRAEQLVGIIEKL